MIGDLQAGFVPILGYPEGDSSKLGFGFCAHPTSAPHCPWPSIDIDTVPITPPTR